MAKKDETKEVIGDKDIGGWFPDSYLEFLKAVWRVVYIIPCLIMGILYGITSGFESGLKKVIQMYEEDKKDGEK